MSAEAVAKQLAFFVQAAAKMGAWWPFKSATLPPAAFKIVALPSAANSTLLLPSGEESGGIKSRYLGGS
jgi:hypothetical protein